MTTKSENLVKILAEIKDLRSRAEGATPGTAASAGWEAYAREARYLLPTAEDRYFADVQPTLLLFIVDGPHANAWALEAQALADMHVINDGQEMYTRIADRIWPTIGHRKEFGLGSYADVIHELQLIGQELGIASMPVPRWQEVRAAPDQETVARICQELIEPLPGPGPELQALYLRRQIGKVALANGADQKVNAIIILRPPSSAVLDLVAGPERQYALTPTAAELDEKAIMEVLQAAKKKYNTRKKATP